MKAAFVKQLMEPLRVEETAVPEPGADEVLLKVEASGVCHSDLHIASGDWPGLMKQITLPLIPGHEVVGRVVKRGYEVTELDLGDRAGVAWVHWTCGECEPCRAGLENLCPNQKITGATVAGGYAEYMKAKASHAIKVPDNLSSEEAAPLFCAGVTVYRAIKNSGIEPGQRVAIFGIGGLGHLAVQIAKTYGAEVIAVDITDEKLALARACGADHTINSASNNAARKIREMGGAHFSVVTAAAKAAYDIAFRSLRPRGTLVVVGLPADDLTFNPNAMSSAETRIISSSVGTREDMREVLDLAAGGKVRCEIETRRLDQINEVFDQMRGAQITGRLVLTFDR
ncbi:MAG TPA: zinc-dependent alcohol dehydrogenase [Blastocatellia bacterium]|nr:zinc-dependent alcohol dehydrogenase [Blastocatellia bacterium]